MLWSIEKTFFISQLKIIQEHIIKLEKLQLVKKDDYTTGCLLGYNYFDIYYKTIATDLSKQQAFDADIKAIQQINFTGNLNRGENVNDNTMFFIIAEAKENIDFSQGTVKALWMCSRILFYVNIVSI